LLGNFLAEKPINGSQKYPAHYRLDANECSAIGLDAKKGGDRGNEEGHNMDTSYSEKKVSILFGKYDLNESICYLPKKGFNFLYTLFLKG
jgi:hypothetical protein